MLSISAVVVSYNSGKFLRDNIESLLAQTEPFGEIIIVDNGSTDNSLQIISRYAEVKLIRPERNIGYSAALNLGIKASRSSLVLAANSDIRLDRNFNRMMKGRFEEDPGLDMASPLLLRFDGCTVDSAGQFFSMSLYPVEKGFSVPRDRVDLRERDVFSVCGAATVFRRESLERLKVEGEYYDESFFMFWEDFDIGWRASLYGMTARLIPGAEVYHFRGGTLKPSFLTRFSMALSRPGEIKFHLVKNRYLVLIKNFRFSSHWFRIPAMALKDLVWVGMLTLSCPKIIIQLMGSIGIFRTAFKRRKIIKNNE